VLPSVYTVPTDPDDPPLHEWPGGVLSTVPDPTPVPSVPEELEPSSPGAITAATFGAIALFVLLGYGWARWALGCSGVGTWSAAAGFGVGALILAALAVDRVGVGLDGRLGPLLASALAGGGGYALWLLGSRRVGADPDIGERQALADQPPEVP
jgi:hypothetical protein